MSFDFHPDAEAELLEAIQYYENVEPGLGQDFAVEVYSAVQRPSLIHVPGRFSKGRLDAHSCGDFRMGFCTLRKVMEF